MCDLGVRSYGASQHTMTTVSWLLELPVRLCRAHAGLRRGRDSRSQRGHRDTAILLSTARFRSLFQLCPFIDSGPSPALHPIMEAEMKKITTLATAKTVSRIEAYINEFSYSTHYRVDPDTLLITNETRPVPVTWLVKRHRGGYLFGTVR